MPPRFFAAPPPLSSTDDPFAVIAAKSALRSQARTARKDMKRAVPDAARRAAALAPLERLLPGRPCVVAIYHPIGAELDPRPLAARCRAMGAAVAAPVVVEHGAALLFRLYSDNQLAPDSLGLAAPPPHAPEVRPDVVIVPLLAFDATGARLGQGGGFYDRTLAELRAQGPVMAVGLAYAGQQVECIPTDRFDQRLDGVLTETAYLDLTGDR